MNRRATLGLLLGKPVQSEATAVSPAAGSSAGLEPYAGAWGPAEAAHLLRRAMFGPTRADLNWAAAQDLNTVLDALLEDRPLPEPPLNYNEEDDPNVPIGESWVDAPLVGFKNLQPNRYKSLEAWTLGLMIGEGVSLREKMTLFWHNHFAVIEDDVGDPRFAYTYVNTLRTHAWGNFRELVKLITIDPAMLRFLNGNQNTKKAPNENYARELLELYTVGKGPQVAPGDYTNFTEQDVLEISRILTGWKDRGWRTNNPDQAVESFFQDNEHDTGDKQLSPRFNDAVISDMGDQEYAHLIDIIFQQPAAARHICRKLYRWFVYYHIDDNIESTIIEPLAQLLIDNDFEVKPVLRTLLSSAHFFDMRYVGPMIKHPFDFVVSAIKQLEVPFPAPDEDLFSLYEGWRELMQEARKMNMDYFNPPEVAGWKAWYQAPVYSRDWINLNTLLARLSFTAELLNDGIKAGDDFRIRAELLDLIATFDNPTNPNAMIRTLADVLFPMPLTGEMDANGSYTTGQYKGLKEVLIPGLPDFEWTIEYGDYLANPDDPDIKKAVEDKLVEMVGIMLSLAEFHLS